MSPGSPHSAISLQARCTAAFLLEPSGARGGPIISHSSTGWKGGRVNTTWGWSSASEERRWWMGSRTFGKAVCMVLGRVPPEEGWPPASVIHPTLSLSLPPSPCCSHWLLGSPPRSMTCPRSKPQTLLSRNSKPRPTIPLTAGTVFVPASEGHPVFAGVSRDERSSRCPG